MNITTEEKQKWILENCVTDSGVIDLKYLDFAERTVELTCMKAYVINQNCHKAKIIYQGSHVVDVIFQGFHKANSIYQYYHRADQIYQQEHEANIIVQNEQKARYILPQDLTDYNAPNEETNHLFERKKVEYTYQQLVNIVGHDFCIKEEE